MSTDAERLSLEILKLLLQVVWADHEVSSDEVEHVLDLAKSAGVTDEDMAMLRACLGGEAQLPLPDLGFLRSHREKTLAAVETLIHADAQIAADETAVLGQIRELLGAGE